MKKLLTCLWVGVLCLHHTAWAGDLDLLGTHEQTIPTHPSNPDHATDTKDITLLDYAISDQLQSELYQQVQRRLEQQPGEQRRSLLAIAMPQKIQLGMDHVPVLDQGKHASCVVFANTAAIDAALHKGNYISQLCLLQLGYYLESNGGGKSGWQGLSSNELLDRIETYGIISLRNQRQHGCGGLTSYPYSTTPQTGMSPEVYGQYQEKIFSKEVAWTVLFRKSKQAFRIKDTAIVSKTKQALNKGARVVVGALLPRSDLGTMGAVGIHHVLDDTWVLTHEIAQELQSSHIISGHEMIITGFDDEASARDHAGHVHQGLFTLRNSWGWYAGDWGDFYMSYDYFNALVMHGVVISDTSFALS